MNRLTSLQRRAARILFGLPDSHGFALAGGSALVALGVVNRMTRDLDAFIAAEPGNPPGDETIEVDLAVDSPPLFPPQQVDGIPSLTAEDLAARKILAILDRVEGRDFTDLWALSTQLGRVECVAWAQQLDSGVSQHDVAAGFARLEQLGDNELPCDELEQAAVRRWFAEWTQELHPTS